MQINKDIIIWNYNFAVKMDRKVGLCQYSPFIIRDYIIIYLKSIISRQINSLKNISCFTHVIFSQNHDISLYVWSIWNTQINPYSIVKV